VTLAGLKKLVAQGHVGKQESVVLLLTGHTLKDPEYTIDFHRGKLLTARETDVMRPDQRKQMERLASAPQVLEPTAEAVMRVLDVAVQGRSAQDRSKREQAGRG
jgi:threonine synthase